MAASTTVYVARKVLTLNPALPQAEAVAVRDGRILAAGTADELTGIGHWAPVEIDRTFADKVLLPGFVEAHGHAQSEGLSWTTPYVGFYDRAAPDGSTAQGCRSNEEVLARLRAAEAGLATADEPLLAWGYDPLFLDGPPLSATQLDRVTSARPLLVRHASGHLSVTNHALLRLASISADADLVGVARDARGEPTGVLAAGAMHRARAAVGGAGPTLESLIAATHAFGRLACRAGCTTVTDIAFGGAHEQLAYAAYAAATSDPRFPARVVLAHTAASLHAKGGPMEAVAHLRAVRARDTDRLRSGAVKVFVDGSIQGFTARLNWPGYHNGRENGLFLTAPDGLLDLTLPFHRAGFQLRFHTNGDQAIDAALDALEALLARAPRWDHRHTLEHCQTATPAQFRRMAALGVCANLFPNHLYYWGDIHHALTLGPERAARMNAAGTALRCGVQIAFHADPPVTPLAPLFSAWAAVQRRSAGGRVLGLGERISAADALRAVTIGPATLLKLDHEIGSIEAGKRADFAVLEDDPLSVPPEALKGVPVWGTVLGGIPFPATGV